MSNHVRTIFLKMRVNYILPKEFIAVCIKKLQECAIDLQNVLDSHMPNNSEMGRATVVINNFVLKELKTFNDDLYHDFIEKNEVLGRPYFEFISLRTLRRAFNVYNSIPPNASEELIEVLGYIVYGHNWHKAKSQFTFIPKKQDQSKEYSYELLREDIANVYQSDNIYKRIYLPGDMVGIGGLDMNDYFISLSFNSRDEYSSNTELMQMEREGFEVKKRKWGIDNVQSKYFTIEEITDKLLTRQNQSLILGNPGVGKSTFSYWLCNKWANRLLGKDLLLIHLNLRKVQFDKKRPIIEYIKIQYELTDKSVREIYEVLVKNKDRIIYVLDGLDELKIDDHKVLLNDLLNLSDQYTVPRFILLSRPYGILNSQFERWKDGFEIIGFSDSNRFNYIKSIFPIQTITAKKAVVDLETIFKNNYVLDEISRTPLYLSYIVVIYVSEGLEELKNVKSSYALQNKILEMLIDYHQKHKELDIFKYGQIINECKHFAAYLELTKKFVFRSSSIRDPFYQSAIMLNRLGVGTTSSLKNNWYFHFNTITFQEFLSSEFLGDSITSESFLYLVGDPTYWNLSKMILGYLTFKNRLDLLENIINSIDSIRESSYKTKIKCFVFGELSEELIAKFLDKRIINELQLEYKWIAHDLAWNIIYLESIRLIYLKCTINQKDLFTEFIAEHLSNIQVDPYNSKNVFFPTFLIDLVKELAISNKILVEVIISKILFLEDLLKGVNVLTKVKLEQDRISTIHYCVGKLYELLNKMNPIEIAHNFLFVNKMGIYYPFLEGDLLSDLVVKLDSWEIVFNYIKTISVGEFNLLNDENKINFINHYSWCFWSLSRLAESKNQKEKSLSYVNQLYKTIITFIYPNGPNAESIEFIAMALFILDETNLLNAIALLDSCKSVKTFDIENYNYYLNLLQTEFHEEYPNAISILQLFQYINIGKYVLSDFLLNTIELIVNFLRKNQKDDIKLKEIIDYTKSVFYFSYDKELLVDSLYENRLNSIPQVKSKLITDLIIMNYPYIADEVWQDIFNEAVLDEGNTECMFSLLGGQNFYFYPQNINRLEMIWNLIIQKKKTFSPYEATTILFSAFHTYELLKLSNNLNSIILSNIHAKLIDEKFINVICHPASSFLQSSVFLIYPLLFKIFGVKGAVLTNRFEPKLERKMLDSNHFYALLYNEFGHDFDFYKKCLGSKIRKKLENYLVNKIEYKLNSKIFLSLLANPHLLEPHLFPK
jgi:hypothetical protein